MPKILLKDKSVLKPYIERFNTIFEQKTGYKPVVISNPTKNDFVIELSFYKDEKSGFQIIHNTNKLLIKATSEQEMSFALNYFFAEYFKNNSPLEKPFLDKISIPLNLKHSNIADFEYREPYFQENFNAESRQQYMTHTLEDSWGLWGHNISKVIKRTNAMMAVIDGKANENQFCFSSPELENALKTYILNQLINNPKADKFMIMPDDNSLVCQCEKCTELGNTKTSTSPAVFTLLNNLANQFPDKQFFGTAYITTKNPPKKTFAKNVGIMLSTMDFPKGVVLENSPKKEFITETIASWKKVTDKIFLWDYAINFDNYLESYPTVNIAQKNLQFYKKQGVSGVFMQGNEHDYAAFEELKYVLYAKLLRNVDTNLQKETKLFFDENYPSVSDLLFEYYTQIENIAFKSKRQLDIYGGWNQAKKKYLEESNFFEFYDKFSQKVQTLNREEYKSIEKLYLALTFQALEFARTNGISENGYATLNTESHSSAIIKPEIKIWIDRLKKHSDIGIEKYNEQGYLINDYIQLWENEILNKEYKNLLFGKKVKALTELDEDYSNLKMLTDGAIGFTDYYNNWLLFTVTDEIVFEINSDDVKGAKELRLSFLNSPKHRIYLPHQVLVSQVEGKISTEIEQSVGTTPSKHEVVIPLTEVNNSEVIQIRIIKQKDYTNKSIACDEIIFR